MVMDMVKGTVDLWTQCPHPSKQANKVIMEMVYQAMGLVYTVIVADAQAKMSLPKIRQRLLETGIGELADTIRKQARKTVGATEFKPLDELLSSLLETIMSDWS